MKKTLILIFIFAFAVSLAPVEKARAVITEEEMSGNPIDNEDHFIWDLMAQLQTPDDPDCEDVAEAALLAGGIPAESVAGPRDGACAGMASMRTNMESGMGGGGEAVETNLFDATDWHSVENLYFQHSTDGVADGRIAFTNPIDFMSFNFMTFMMNFGNAMDTGEGLIGLDADIVDGMAGYGAVLTMYNVDDFENPEILVDGAEDTEGIVSGLVYDRENHTITFNAAHFTEFEVVEGDADEDPDVDKIKAKKYFNSSIGKWRVKLIVKGDNYDKNTEVTLGNRSAYKVKYKSKHKIIAYFSLDKLLKAGKDELVVRVINGDETEKFGKKLKLSELDASYQKL